MRQLPKINTSRNRERQLQRLSPFELKDTLIALADTLHLHRQSSMLNAGRGNPNWTAVAPREAFFALGRFAMEQCRADMQNKSGFGGVPQRTGVSKALYKFLQTHKGEVGVDTLAQMFRTTVAWLDKGELDDMVFEFVEGIVGCQYPEPVRMLPYCERAVRRYLLQELCGRDYPEGKVATPPVKYDLFATEGGTAAMCYIFDSLVQNFLLKPGDKVALGVPAFTPYLEIPQLEKYHFDVTYIMGSQRNPDGTRNYQYPPEELDKLGDKNIKAFFVINPSNPCSVMMNADTCKYLVNVVKKLNPNLMILTDDVYGTFVEGFRSLMETLPRNTLTVYSFSKYFGCTGWRLGTIALAENNIFDEMLTAIPSELRARLNTMYSTLTLHPEKMKFIDRLAANSRDVALNHTAGLSTPQQVQMALFAIFALIDHAKNKDAYKKTCTDLVHRRFDMFWQAAGIRVEPDPNRAAYYGTFDLKDWAIKTHGQSFFDWLSKHFEPVDLVFRMAEECSVVLLNGGGFAAPAWSVRISLANLDDHDYTTIGHILAAILGEYVTSWRADGGA